MSVISTTHGDLEVTTLRRSVLFSDLPDEFTVIEEYRLPHDTAACPICADPAYVRPESATLALVKRNAHVILKQPSVVATAIAATIG